ncbi:o-succinylbenzoate synthase [Chondrinema litorale]|uniref:o-succinylbenzoate synthase n=1 Tax=Chondrinema litorale TaxID=2994555 RepID=UPI0025434A39|nr:o-succinylbenzoate synthase [Chondrinema litorale]UZR93280.1 o-succinylbenzoate synthase [Chondrinema litorale]
MSFYKKNGSSFTVEIRKHILKFNFPAKTSRGAINKKVTYFLKITDLKTGIFGIGECSPLPGLSLEYDESYEEKLIFYADELLNLGKLESFYELPDIKLYPSILFGVEIAYHDLIKGGNKLLFDSSFATGQEGIPINGLVWMGDKDFMLKQMTEKLEKGFNCIKIKIGGIDFEDECFLLKILRQQFTESDITIRLDANGAFKPDNALDKLEKLSQFSIHSIEQPIKQGQWNEMAMVCEKSPIAIALDEELIGITDKSAKIKMLEAINPQYIILKPSLIGGFKMSDEWIKLAESKKIGWWITSALEANVGLNAIAQYTAIYNDLIPQGLGTGQLYHNNIDSPLEIQDGKLHLKLNNKWQEVFQRE